MAYESKDVLCAREGKLFLDGEEVFNSIKIELTVEKEKAEIKRLGKRMTGHKAVGLSASGTITEYHATSKAGMLLQKYKDTGVDPYFEGIATLYDPNSNRGTERIAMSGINFDSAVIISLDGEGDVIQDELPFTIEDFYYIDQLKEKA